jgi:hypothetical protein
MGTYSNGDTLKHEQFVLADKVDSCSESHFTLFSPTANFPLPVLKLPGSTSS